MGVERDKVAVMTTLASYHLERARMALHEAVRLMRSPARLDPVKIGSALHESAKHAGVSRGVARLVGDTNFLFAAKNLLEQVDQLLSGFLLGKFPPLMTDGYAADQSSGNLVAIRCGRCKSYFFPSAGKCPTCGLKKVSS